LLQWRPQFYTVLAVAVLVTLAFLAGLANVGSQFGW
jgi:hypothetical protein